jgi:GxxExxY protein
MRNRYEHNDLTQRIIGCAIAVHKALGPGFLEKVYEEAMCLELSHGGLRYHRQKIVPLSYRHQQIGIHRLDLVIENTVVVELKAISELDDIHYATVISYLKASGLPLALLLNFAHPVLATRRFANSLLKLNAEAQKSGNAENLVKFLRTEGHDEPSKD